VARGISPMGNSAAARRTRHHGDLVGGLGYIPLGTDANDMPFMKYGRESQTMLDSFHGEPEIAEEKDEVSMIEVTYHAHVFGHPCGAYYYEKIVEAAAKKPEIWIDTRARQVV
jgi:hypothetical protein